MTSPSAVVAVLEAARAKRRARLPLPKSCRRRARKVLRGIVRGPLIDLGNGWTRHPVAVPLVALDHGVHFTTLERVLDGKRLPSHALARRALPRAKAGA